MPLGIGAGLLAGAGQGFLDLQRQAEEKRRQELQQLYALQTLKSLQGQSEISGLGGGFGFTPPDINQPSPVGDGAGLGSPIGGGAPPSSYTPGKGFGFSGLRDLALKAGYPPQGATTQAAIDMAESGGNPRAYNPNDPGGSYGIGQINAKAHPDMRMSFDPAENMRQQFQISRGGQDFSPWSTYKSGAYRRFMPQGTQPVNAAGMSPPDTSPQGRTEGARMLGLTEAQFSPQQQGPDTYNRAVQEYLKARQKAQQEIVRRTPNATPQQRKQAFEEEWEKPAKAWLEGVKEQNARAAEQGRYERGHADEESRFRRGQAAEQARHERNLEEQSKELGTGSNYEITDKEGKVLWQGVAREGKKGGLFDEGGARLDTQFKDAKITKLPTSQQLIGSRENVLIQRSLTAGIEVASELENLTKLPLSSSSGPLGGRKQGPGLIDATKERLANWFTPMNDKFYNDSIAGMGREIGGLVNSGVYINQHTIDSFKQLEFQTTDEPEVKLHKLATLRQNTENALQSVLANPRVAPTQRAFAQQMIDRVQKAIPFTPGDVIGWANSGDPNQTIGQYVKQVQSGVEEGKAEKLGQPGTEGATPSYKSPDDVKAAVQSGKLDKDGALKILRDQFGMQ